VPPARVEAAARSNDVSWQAIALLAYALGATVFFVRLGLGMRQARRLVRESTMVAGRLTNPRCRTPVTVGLRAPVVILPPDWVAWPESELKAILAHEHEHASCRDPLASVVTLLARAVFWFHPLAWWLHRHVATLSEQACDAAVLAHGHDADDYAFSLVRFARLQAVNGGRFTFPGSAMPGAGLKQRLHLLDQPINRCLAPKRVLALTLVYIAVVVLSAAATPKARSRTPEDPPAQSSVTPRPPAGGQVASSDHFEILHRPAQANRVKDLIWEAERAYQHVAEALKYDLAARVSLVFVAGDGDVEDTLAPVAAGGTSGQRIVISVESLDSRPGIMVHELTHQFAFDILPEVSHQSPWLIEGLAEHQRGVWDANDVRRIREAIAGAWVPELAALPGADRIWSHAWFDYVASAYGGEGIRRFLFVLSRDSRVPAAVTAAFNVSVEAFDKSFRQYMVGRFGAQ
jgi:hypothetical protein